MNYIFSTILVLTIVSEKPRKFRSVTRTLKAKVSDEGIRALQFLSGFKFIVSPRQAHLKNTRVLNLNRITPLVYDYLPL